MEYKALTRKFGLNYELRIESSTTGKMLVIEPPMTVEVNVARNLLASVNNCSLRIYNLSEDRRNQIQKNVGEQGLIKKIELRAGFGKNLYTIFSGNVRWAYSQRERTNNITTVEAFDGGFAMAKANIETTLKAGTPMREVVNILVSSMKKFDVTSGEIGRIDGATLRGISLSGNSYDLLQTITGNRVFIDNKKVNILSEDETIVGSLAEISSESGLLGTPRVENTKLNFELVFEPRLTIGQKVSIKSEVQKKLFDGQEYKVFSLAHRGMFSSSVAGSMVTEAGCLFAPSGFKRVRA